MTSDFEDSYKKQRQGELAFIPNIYPNNFRVTSSVENFVTVYQHLQACEYGRTIESIGGRITSIRSTGSKLFFIFIKEFNSKIQVFADNKQYPDYDDYQRFKKSLKRGDYIGITGLAYRTKTNELSIVPQNIVMLAPCYHQIPKRKKKLVDDILVKDPQVFTDDNLRFSQRYLDMIIHKNVRQTILTRSNINKFIRTFLNNRGFIEVETPILCPRLGGANAQPFITTHNELDIDLFLRVAPELYLKQLVIGGLPKIYELGKQFRNEGIDATHNPEFTSLEVYSQYSDYNDMLLLTERLLSELIYSIKGSLIIEYQGQTIDFTPPFRRYDIWTDLQQAGGFTFPSDDIDSLPFRNFLISLCVERNITCYEPLTTARLLDKLISCYLEPLCINPTFLMNHPQIMSPLAKPLTNGGNANQMLTERFELFVNRFELANAYSELNDPELQKKCFLKQFEDKQKGDAECPDIDNSYIKALEYGLPPTGGLGIGIDRLLMICTNQSVLKEVLTFLPNH